MELSTQRKGPENLRWPDWTARQVAAVNRALDQLEREVSSWGDDFLFGQIATITALGYVDFRLKLDWRATRPALAAWEAKVGQRESVKGTVPVE